METSLTHKKPTGQSHAFRALKKEEDTFIRPQPPLRAATWWENPLLLLRRRGENYTVGEHWHTGFVATGGNAGSSFGAVVARALRRYCQSTSWRKSSGAMAPEDSTAIRKHKPSPNFWPIDAALRRYPTVVLQRVAKASCSTTLRLLRYAMSFSMGRDYTPGYCSKQYPGAIYPKVCDGNNCPYAY